MARSSIEQDRVGKQIVSSNSGVRLVRHGLPLALLAVVLPCGVVSVSDAALVGDLGSTCVGDCDASGAITVDELVNGVSVALGMLPLDQCRDSTATRPVSHPPSAISCATHVASRANWLSSAEAGDCRRRLRIDIALGVAYGPEQFRGRNSAVECQLPKLDVAGSTPVARSLRTPLCSGVRLSLVEPQFPSGIVSSVSFVSTTNTARSLAGFVLLALALTAWRSPGSSEKCSPAL